MSPWDLLVDILGWVLVALMILAVVFTAIIMVVGIVYGIGKTFGASWADDKSKR